MNEDNITIVENVAKDYYGANNIKLIAPRETSQSSRIYGAVWNYANSDKGRRDSLLMIPQDHPYYILKDGRLAGVCFNPYIDPERADDQDYIDSIFEWYVNACSELKTKIIVLKPEYCMYAPGKAISIVILRQKRMTKGA